MNEQTNTEESATINGVSIFECSLPDRMLAITGACEAKKPDGHVSHGKTDYHYASHNAVTELLQPLFCKYRVDAVPTITNFTRDVIEVFKDGQPIKKNLVTVYFTIAFINVDTPTEVEIMPWIAEAMGNDDKQIAIAMSSGVRNAYQKRFKLRSGDSDLEKGNLLDDDQSHEQSTASREPYVPPHKKADQEVPAKDKKEYKKISPAQDTRFYAISKANNWERGCVDNLLEEYGFKNTRDITWNVYDELIGKLKGEDRSSKVSDPAPPPEDDDIPF